MQQEQIIEHQGLVKSVDQSSVFVSIVSESACVSCKVKGSCGVSDVQEKIVEIPKSKIEFIPGESVKVIMSQGQGFRALFLGFLLPFLVMITTLLLVLLFAKHEASAGLASVVILVPYYFGLYLMRDNIKRKFSFSIRKL